MITTINVKATEGGRHLEICLFIGYGAPLLTGNFDALWYHPYTTFAKLREGVVSVTLTQFIIPTPSYLECGPN